jgi:glycosyltransferase involved in cell wall biosynthesis
MALRIAHITATFPPYFGGTGNVCFQNARELARRGHDVHVYTSQVNGSPAKERIHDITVTRLPSVLRSGNAHLLPGLLTSVRNFDIVHLHYPFYGGELTALASWWQRTPLVVTYHQDVHLTGAIRYVEVMMRHTLGRTALRSASRLLFTTADYGQSSYTYGMLQDRAHVIGELPNGVDTSVFQPAASQRDSRAELGLSPDGKYVLLVARLDRAHYFKGVDVLLQALHRLPNDVRAIIVGDGDLREKYRREAEVMGIGNQVMFTGRVSDAQLPVYYQSADITLLPSTTMGEAFGLVLIESMACGTPVIASNLPGVRAVVEPGLDGLLVEPGNHEDLAVSITQLLENPTLLKSLGHAGRQKAVQHYDWRDIGERLEVIYRDVIFESTRNATGLVAEED